MGPGAFCLLHLESFLLGNLVLAACVEVLSGGDGLHARAELVHGLYPLVVRVGVEDDATACKVSINENIKYGRENNSPA